MLTFHPDKCHVLTIGKFTNIRYTHRYKVYGKELEHVFAEKYLGVVMDAELNFEEHVGENQQSECSNGIDSTKVQFPRLSFIQEVVHYFC